jgi:hypothetical protein
MSEQHQNLIRTIESQRARIEALEAALRRIDAINDSPAIFNKDIDDVCHAALTQEQPK